MTLIEADLLTELTRETMEWSLKLCPQRSEQEHLDHAFAAVADLLGDTPDAWIAAALDRAAEQLGMVAA